MTGPEHYAEAEKLLAQAEVDAGDPMRKYAEDANLIAAAHVHATLALTSVQQDVADEAARLRESVVEFVHATMGDYPPHIYVDGRR